MSTSLDGLVSGLSTNQLISQLMTLERQPQLRLQASADSTQRVADAYRGVTTRLTSLGDAARSLTKTGGWEALKVSSSDATRVTASLGTGASVGAFTFSIETLAAAGSAVSSGTVSATTDNVTAATSIDVVKGTTRTTVSVGTGSLADVVKGINDAAIGVTATAVQVSPGSFKLQLTSTTTGAGTNIAVDDGAGGSPFASSTLGAVQPLVTGRDAELRVGGAAGYTVTRSTNTVSDLLTGVTLTLVKADPGVNVTVDVAVDPAAVADRVAKLVDTTNAVLSEIKRLSAYDAASKRAGLLAGDSLVRRIQQDLVRAVTDTVAGGAPTNPSGAGLSVKRDGTLTFDRTTFLDAYGDDPGGVERLLGADGVAGRVEDVVAWTTTTGTGALQVAVAGREDSLRGINASIDAWDTRLADRERALRLQFTGLETALARMQSQSQWLSGQLTALF